MDRHRTLKIDPYRGNPKYNYSRNVITHQYFVLFFPISCVNINAKMEKYLNNSEAKLGILIASPDLLL